MDKNKNYVDNGESESLDLTILWNIFKRRWYIIILVAILAGLGAGTFGYVRYVPQYSASISFLIEVDPSFTSQYQNSNINDTIVHTYEVAFRHNREFCQELNEFAGTADELGYTADDVASMMSCHQVIENTPTLQITFTCPHPLAAYNLAVALQVLANEELRSKFNNLSEVDVFNEPIEPTAPSSTNPFVKMFALGFIGGAVLMYAIFLLAAVTDKTIHGEASMEAFADYPLLGVVPTFATKRSGRSGGKSKSVRN